MRNAAKNRYIFDKGENNLISMIFTWVAGVFEAIGRAVSRAVKEESEFVPTAWPPPRRKPQKKEIGEIPLEEPVDKMVRKHKYEDDTEFDIRSSPISFGDGIEMNYSDDLEVLPTYVSKFDQLMEDGGLERGTTLLISGGAGTGKTTFSLQSLYYGALKGERGIYISFEEQPSKIKAHMKKNYGWGFYELEEKNLVAVIRIDPAKIARSIEEAMLEKGGNLKIGMRKIELPFVPDRIVVDSLSALSIAFEKEEAYRKYLRELFEALEVSNAVSLVLSETEQNPKVYSRTGVEEFLADGVIVLYNLKRDGKRENALEILKLRSCRHKKGIVPYTFTKNGLEVSVK